MNSAISAACIAKPAMTKYRRSARHVPKYSAHIRARCATPVIHPYPAPAALRLPTAIISASAEQVAADSRCSSVGDSPLR